MQHEFSAEDVVKVVRDFNDLIRRIATDFSIARLLAEYEPIGELVVLSLLDDSMPVSDLGARLKVLSDWLKKTEELYDAQFPEGFPKKDGRYDLTNKPPQFKSRLDIFKEQVERWESSKLWSAEIVFNDPVAVIKRMKPIPEPG